MLSSDQYSASIDRAASALIDIVRRQDLAIAVPDCPAWTLLDLARHVGGIHRWAHAAIVLGRPTDVDEGPDDAGELVRWMSEGAVQLLDVLRTMPPDAPAWTFGPEPHNVFFWSRRQAHETSMHLVDAQRALGSPPELDSSLALDGIDEVVSMFFPRQVRLGRIAPLEHAVLLVVDDAPDSQFVIAGDGLDPHAQTQASATGSATDLLLALWGRKPVEELTIEGDPAVVRNVFSARITP